MRSRFIVLVFLTILGACASESEVDRIVRMLNSGTYREVVRGLDGVDQMRKDRPRPQRPAPPPALTAGEERVVRAMRELLARTTDLHLKSLIASTMEPLRVPGPQPELVQCALANDAEASPSCIEALAAAGDPANVDELMTLLSDPKNVVEFEEDSDKPILRTTPATDAAMYVADWFGDAAIPPLARLVTAGKQPARELALQALLDFKSDAAAEAAAPALTDENRFVRFFAATVIAAHPAHKELLRPLLNDPGPGARRVAREALGVPPDPASPPDAAPAPLGNRGARP